MTGPQWLTNSGHFTVNVTLFFRTSYFPRDPFSRFQRPLSTDIARSAVSLLLRYLSLLSTRYIKPRTYITCTCQLRVSSRAQQIIYHIISYRSHIVWTTVHIRPTFSTVPPIVCHLSYIIWITFSVRGKKLCRCGGTARRATNTKYHT